MSQSQRINHTYIREHEIDDEKSVVVIVGGKDPESADLDKSQDVTML